jgi:hypothetical protein
MEPEKPDVVVGMPADSKTAIPATEFATECRCCVSRFQVSHECVKIFSFTLLTFLTMACLLRIAEDTSIPIQQTQRAQDAETIAFVLSNLY